MVSYEKRVVRERQRKAVVWASRMTYSSCEPRLENARTT